MALTVRFHPLVAPPSDMSRFPAALLCEMLRAEGVSDDGEVHCILTGDDQLAELNERFRGRPGPTDVLAFPYDAGAGSGVRGDVYVSLDRALAQAAERGEPPGREVWRLFVHGALHLAGQGHETPARDRDMRATQEAWVERGYPSPPS